MEPTLDQLKLFAAVVDAGSFSAAARKLRRAQSAVSYGIANLEKQLDVRLFERQSRAPTLTPAGEALLVDTREILRRVGDMGARARNIASGVEPRISVAVDSMFPMAPLIAAARALSEAHPMVTLHVRTEGLGAVAAAVRDGVCSFGICVPLQSFPPDLERSDLCTIKLVSVAAPGHPLATGGGKVSARSAKEHVQIVLTDRSELTRGVDFGVHADRTWRVSDLPMKHELIRAGLGWGSLPEHTVAADLAAGRLVPLSVAARDPVTVQYLLITGASNAPGPASRWLIEEIRKSTHWH